MSMSYITESCDSSIDLGLSLTDYPIILACERLKGHDGQHRARHTGISTSDELFVQKIEERLPKVDAQFIALNRLNTSRWKKLPNHTHDWNAVIQHLQDKLEKMKLTEEKVSVEKEFLQDMTGMQISFLVEWTDDEIMVKKGEDLQGQ